MEVVGGFMVMMSIIGLFLAVVWLIMPFVVFAIKGKQDRTLDVLEAIEKRLASLEAAVKTLEPERDKAVQAGCKAASGTNPVDNALTESETAAGKKDQEETQAV